MGPMKIDLNVTIRDDPKIEKLIKTAQALREADEYFQGEMPVKYITDLYQALHDVEKNE
jgi:hypothetical protein